MCTEKYLGEGGGDREILPGNGFVENLDILSIFSADSSEMFEFSVCGFLSFEMFFFFY